MTTPDHHNTSIDLDRFNAVFFEECAEHLADMEHILVALDPAHPDGEELNALFRAAHSIKGGAGIFGFRDLTVVTHELESLLDKVRGNELGLTATMIDLFLEARDAIAMQLAGHRDGAAVDQGVIEDICRRLRDQIETNAAAAEASTSSHVPSAEPMTGFRRLEIVFSPDNDIFQRGVRLENLFNELAQLGDLSVKAEIPEAPPFEAFDPEVCHARWIFALDTAAADEEIWDIFEFVAEREQLTIITRDEQATAAPSPAREDIPAPASTPAEAAIAPMGRRAYDRDETAPGAFGRRGGEAESSIRVGVTKVDQLINQVGELVITQSMLSQMAAVLDPVLFENIHRGLLQLERNTRDLQQSVMSIRLVPISIVFSRFPRLVRDLAAKLGKQVDLKTVGEATELDKGLIEKVADPLTHLVRNCLDHGLESPEARMAAGKDPVGTITLRASQVGGRIVIDVMDDGAGLSREKILRKAAERGIPASDAMTDEEVWQLIFAPGFSTAETVTDISGRGVGMDVVLRNVQALSGRVQVSSEPGAGTRVTISLPLTLAILDGLSVAVGGEKFIIPLNAIIESLQPKPEEIKSVNGRTVVHVRGEYLPLLPLHQLFNLETAVTRAEEGIVVLVDVEGEKAALLVDALLDEHQVVIKSLEANYRKVEGTAGATILGDGRVALILDVHALLRMR
ncbi:chemotaxis protein CheW [Geobacter hydrogenophilus]|uniref:Chemotaxis protein CheA n=1 Tax=Geobacter hydrogenophilus TaxID=40983 RepID=A0A9W6FY40_9BACT|nr:chemotaxis protein CheW [Geobacter hydrogenophilus]MBT0895128.1 chemotaxis protein CheW [Geobacter hydrogenophilus]GLI36954.1 chemotaxis protein CheA [Geobacter hydrogenophilus]